MTQATMADAVREFAWNHGAIVPEQEWLIHDYDVWVRNPHYTGEPGPHPEDDPVFDDDEPRGPAAGLDADDIPF